MDLFGMDEEGRLDLFGWAEADEADAGWDPSDEVDAREDDGDGPEGWLRSLPPGLRAEVEARPPAVTPWDGPVAVRAGFADGGYCDTMLPGAGLAGMLAEATVDGYRGLSDDELAGVLRACKRQVAHDQAQLAAVVRFLAERRGAGSSRAAEHTADELMAELTLTGRQAGRQLDVSDRLGRLPAVSDALLSGFIDWPRACVFADELAVLDDATAAGIADRLADPAAGWTTGQLRAALARAVLAADPAAAERRKKTARKETRVELWREGSGNAALAGRELRPSSAIRLDRKLDADAGWLAACGVPGSKSELRVLAYTTLLSGRDLAAILDDPASWPQDAGTRDGAGDSAAGARGTGDGADRHGRGTAAGSRDRGAATDSRDVSAAATGRGGPVGSGTRGRLGTGASGARGGGPGVSGPRGRAAGAGAGAGEPPQAGSIHLTMPLSAWLGGGEPGEVPGYGAVDAGTSRELAQILARDPATRWCLTLTGAGGQAVAHACP